MSLTGISANALNMVSTISLAVAAIIFLIVVIRIIFTRVKGDGKDSWGKLIGVLFFAVIALGVISLLTHYAALQSTGADLGQKAIDIAGNTLGELTGK